MTALTSLWMPILGAALLVFIASAIINTILPWHKGDFPRLADEDAFRNAVRPMNIPPGEYMVPRAQHHSELKSPEYLQKVNEGPVMIVTTFPNGQISMGRSLVLWAIYCIVVSAIAACVAWSTLGAGAHDHSLFHVGGIAAFSCYAVGLWQSTIWYGRPWTTTLKSTIDGLIYAALTGLIFTMTWPK